MLTALRTIVAIFAGMAVAFALVIAVELFSAVVHPLPEGFQGTQEEMCLHVERYPAWVLAVVIGMWAFTALAGSWVALRVGNLWSYAVVGVLLVAALMLNISMLPYPLWFKAGTLLALPTSILLAGRLARRPPPTALAAP